MRLSQLLTPWKLLQQTNKPLSSIPNSRSGYRCQVEVLEDRCLLSVGTLDLTFGGTGMVFPEGTDDTWWVSDLAIQEDQKIVSYSEAYDGDNRFGVLTRHNPDGSLDTEFGNGGRASIDFLKDRVWGGRDNTRAVALDSDGGI